VSVRHALLALLSEGPTYGLRLRQEFESRTGEVWPLNGGQVYTTLQRLERDGLVASEDPEREGPQKTFSLTAEGRQELLAWLHSPPETLPPPRDEFVIKVLVALRVPDIDVRGLLQGHRRHLIELMQRYTRLKGDAPESDVGLGLVVDAQLFRLEAIVRWLDAADARLAARPVDGLRPGLRDATDGPRATAGVRPDLRPPPREGSRGAEASASASAPASAPAPQAVRP
jgi:DNA-binding PadR family transcriptional regulator